MKLYRVRVEYRGFTSVLHAPRRLHAALATVAYGQPTRESTWTPAAAERLAAEMEHAMRVLREFDATIRLRPDGSRMIFVAGAQVV